MKSKESFCSFRDVFIQEAIDVYININALLVFLLISKKEFSIFVFCLTVCFLFCKSVKTFSGGIKPL